jgi:hypothetical protein
MTRSLDATRSASVLHLIAIGVAGCGDKAGAAPAGSASAAAAPAGSGPCADAKATHFADNGFCITIPDGYTKGEPAKDGPRTRYRFDDATKTNYFTVTAEDDDPAQFPSTKKSVTANIKGGKDNKVLEEGDLLGGKGFFFHYASTFGGGPPKRHMVVYAHTSKRRFDCRTFEEEANPRPAQMAACKTLVPVE